MDDVKILCVLAAAFVVGAQVGAATVPRGVEYLEARQQPGGGFAEPGSAADPGLTAWVALALRASGRERNDRALDYLERTESRLDTPTAVALAVIAEAALGGRPARLLKRLHALERASGAIGPTVNSTIWGVLALRQAREPVRKETLRYLLARQTRSGGWSWAAGAPPDSNDTAAAIQALRALGVTGKPIRRGLAYLRRCRTQEGGFAVARGRPADAQSTAWALQAYVAARVRPPAASFAYLRRLQRRNGSFRYSRRYATTPVWVTAQVLPALARKPFPLR